MLQCINYFSWRKSIKIILMTTSLGHMIKSHGIAYRFKEILGLYQGFLEEVMSGAEIENEIERRRL